VPVDFHKANEAKGEKTDYLDFFDEFEDRKQFVGEYTESRDCITGVDMDSHVLPRFFYPEVYKKESQIVQLVFIDDNNHPPERFWNRSETLWRFKVSLCKAAPISILTSHFGSDMSLKPDITNLIH
jgi:hypothetical protein